jgi:metallo-beta-lactamase family protein
MAAGLHIRFEGAARTVTGSRHRIGWDGRDWLFDCGLYQGHRDEAERVNRTFREPPDRLAGVVVSHAHLDHTGNLPTLVRAGFRGDIHATPPTVDLSSFMLRDSAYLMQRDVEHVNFKAGRAARQPLYTETDVEETLGRFVPHRYHEPWSIADGVTLEYWDAGHILGSALTVFEFARAGRRFRLGMSGDLGRPGRPILRDPERHPGVDALVVESTYGDRLHEDPEVTERLLAETIARTAARGGRVLVPAFAVGRAQELVATLHELIGQRRIPDLPIFVDSPMARQATATFVRHPECFDAETRRLFEEGEGAPFGFGRLRYVGSSEESKALNDRKGPLIIVSASGMCEGGRILHHLRHGLGNERNTVLFVGYQADGTLGRRILDGAETVNIFGEPVRRRAEVVALGGFSAHADQREILDWVGALEPRPKRIFLVHGEPDAAEVLAGRLRATVGAEVVVPEKDQGFELWT